MSETTPRLEQLLRDAFSALLRDVHIGMPGRVESYDADRQCADVKPLVKRSYRDEGDELTAEEYAVLVDVPVKFPGGGGYAATFPLAVGDTVWLSFASCSLDRWKPSGGLVDPEDERRMALSDAVAYPCVRDFAHALADAPTDRARFGRDGGVALEVTPSEVLVGGGSGHQPTFKATAFLTEFATLIGAIGTAVGGIPGGGAAGTTIATALSDFLAAPSTTLFLTTVAKVR